MPHAPLLLVTNLPDTEEIAWRETLAHAMPDEFVVTPRHFADVGAAEIAVVANPPPGSLRELPGLRWVHSLWAGIDRLLEDETLPDVPIVRLIDPAMARFMAEAVAAVVLSLHRDLHTYAAQQRRREWRQHATRPTSARQVVVLGLGEMGRAAAGLLASLGFAVRGWSRSPKGVCGMTTYAGESGLARAVDGADVLVNLLPLTRATRGLLDRSLFARLAQGAALVNFGRGAHLVDADLLDALAAGRLAHAVLDVFASEPLPRDHPFWLHPGVTILPHISAPTGMASAAALVAAAVREYRSTGRLPEGIDRSKGY